MSGEIVTWTEVAKATLAKAEKYKSTTKGGGSQKDEFSLTKCMQILEGMEEVNDDAYMKAIEKFKDPDWREIFINMSIIRKRAWIRSNQMDDSSSSSADSDFDDFLDFLMLNILSDYNEKFIEKILQRTSALCGEDFVNTKLLCTIGFLPQYRGERYNFQEYNSGSNLPRGMKELFNYRHPSLRNVIEQCFGVLKAHFPILKMMSPYKLSRQPLIVIACCTLHNFIRQRTQYDHMFREWEEKELDGDDNIEEPYTSVSRCEVN
ncbi:uncharacterized protein LOC133815377 [Humulus lupulus]|uniref:uncharacterized protein LOC133815377 n=1 Tax=Humulus lupulus TaxID=3486 RepID=UPI002B411864|nr:uncharacterized protein LOC133815377 [Humulus lupulus]